MNSSSVGDENESEIGSASEEEGRTTDNSEVTDIISGNMDDTNKLEEASDPNDNNIFFHIVHRNWNHVLEILQTEEGRQQVTQKRQGLRMASGQVGVPSDVIQALLEACPDDAKESYGCGLPLHRALYTKETSFDVIKLIIDAYPDGVIERNCLGQLPIHVAAGHSNDETVVRLLIDAYPNGLREQDNDGDLPIHEAARGSHNDSVVKLLATCYREGLQVCNNYGQPPFHCAAMEDPSPKKIKCFLDVYPNGAQIYDSNGWLPIHLACLQSNIQKEALYMLIEACPESIILTCPTNHREKKTCYSSPLEIINGRKSIYYGNVDVTSDDLAPPELLEYLIKEEEMYFISLAQRMTICPSLPHHMDHKNKK